MGLGRWMRSGLMLVPPVLVASCAGNHAPPPPPAPPPQPFYVGSGAGSEHGNYASQQSGEMTTPDGTTCITYVWDRPLTAQLALRLRSASCPSKEHPGLFVANELERRVIPLAESTLADPSE